MLAAVFFKAVSDLCVYFCIANCFASFFGTTANCFAPLLILALAMFLSEALSRRGALKYLPIALIPVCILYMRTVADACMIAPACVYAAFSVIRGRKSLSYSGEHSLFNVLSKVLIPVLVVAVAASDSRPLALNSLLLFAVYLFSSFYTLRIIRHGDRVIADRSFQRANAVTMLLLAALCALLGNSVFLGAMGFVFGGVFGTVYRYVIYPVASVVTYFVSIGIYAASRALMLLVNRVKLGNDQEQESYAFEYQNALLEEIPQYDPPVGLGYIALAFGVLAAVIFLIVLFRRMWKSGRRLETGPSNIVETESEIPVEKGPSIFAPKTAREGVRAQYRKFMKALRYGGYKFDRNFTSLDLNRMVEGRTDGASLASLRNIYIKARYSSSEVDREELSRIKKDYQNVKKDIRGK